MFDIFIIKFRSELVQKDVLPPVNEVRLVLASSVVVFDEFSAEIKLILL
jgi:hypothetical protein